MKFKIWRKIIDSVVVSLVLISSYLAGFLIQLDIGLMTGILILPVVLVLLITYTHLVLRKGRKYGSYEHSLIYELEKTLLFVTLSSLSYTFSVTKSDVFLISTVIALIVSLYVFAYRPHK